MTTRWSGAEDYERLMGRWSRSLAPLLIEFNGVQDGDKVLEVGCGTGSLTRALLERLPRSEIVAMDPATQYIEYLRQQVINSRLLLEVGDAQELPFENDFFDACLSLLVFNFIPDAQRAVAEMRRVTRPGGKVAVAVWDYGQGMEMLRILWDAAVTLYPAVEARHERNMPYCREGELYGLWNETGFQQVEETALTIPTEFGSFEDYWAPFLSVTGPSGTYVTSLPTEKQLALRDEVRHNLQGGTGDGPISLKASAWAVKGTVPMR